MIGCGAGTLAAASKYLRTGLLKKMSENTVNNNRNTFGFVGLGLIGGSIARAIRKYIPGARILAFTPHPETVQEAVSDGVVDEYVPAVGEGFSACDVIFLCAPVEHNASNLQLLGPWIREGTILTDVGSTKADIHRAVRASGLQRYFIGGHPMAGSERIGYRNSKSGLLENAYYILTPEPEAAKEDIDWMFSFAETIKALPLVVSPERHDYAVAAISHVPHVISASLVNLVKESDDTSQFMKTIAAGGFKDITRISSSAPVMWEQICMTNTDNIRILLDRYIEDLLIFRKSLDSGDSRSINEFFDSARQYRESFADISSGPINRSYILHVDIEDRPGVLAEVVMYLAIAGINIKNIGITHNREYQQGVLRVECHSSDGLAKARELLMNRNYSVY